MDGPEILPILARQFDEPLGDSSQVPTYLVSRLARQHCTVVLGGDGGDELFGGYRHYNSLLGAGQEGSSLADAAAGLAGRFLPFGFRGRNYLLSRSSAARGPRLSPRLFDAITLQALVGPERWAFRRPAPGADAGGDQLTRALAIDFRHYLPGDILTKVDRASMLASLEVRAPFLDHRLIEFAFRQVPSRLKATALERKILPKRLAQRVLPAGFDLQRKQGFSIPMGQWLQGRWGDTIYSVLREMPADFLDRSSIEALISGQRRGRSNGEVLFALAMLELWRREYRVAY
jgi:asparagine synthase (glutamine-hydrolysing)